MQLTINNYSRKFKNPVSLGQLTIKGFTLIELLVVISIIGVLSALLMANISGIRERARDAKRKSDLKEIKSALRLYHNDCDTYPSDNNDRNIIQGCGTCDVGVDCNWGGEFTNSEGTIYMKQIPVDPLNTEPYLYHYDWKDRDNFLLKAVLENKSDPDILKSQKRCGVTGEEGTTNYYECPD